MRELNENEEPNFKHTRVVPVPICTSCGQQGHSRSTHHSCPNSRANNNNNNRQENNG